MSLSSHIKTPSSPVRAWLEANLPETRRLATEANRELRSGAKACPTPPVPGADLGLVGTAIDYLLRACLRVTSSERTVASRAVQQLGRESPIGRRAIEVESEAVRVIRKLRPSARELTGEEWSKLCRGCLALARLEQLFRAGLMNPAIFRFVIEPLSRCTDLDDFLSLSVNQQTLQDLEELGRPAWEDCRRLRGARPLILNPNFELSIPLGGADADLIGGRRLIDWKATSQPSIVGRGELWQLAGYALADTPDRFGIREVGIAALRWRSEITWDLADFLEMLAPGPPATLEVLGRDNAKRARVDIEQLRQGFAEAIPKQRGRRRTRSPPISSRGDQGIRHPDRSSEQCEATGAPASRR
jgi:hypothetical protein